MVVPFTRPGIMRARLPHDHAAHVPHHTTVPNPSPSTSHLPRLLSRFDSDLGGMGDVSVTTSDPNDDSQAKTIRDALTFQLHFEYGEQFQQTIAGLALALGILIAFAGVRLLKPLLFLLTWLYVGFLVYLVLMLAFNNSLAAFITGLFVGLCVGGLVLKVWRLALGLVGVLSGLVIWTSLQSAAPIIVTTPIARYTSLAILVLVCTFLVMKLEKVALLIATPLLGSFLFVQGLAHFVAPGAFNALSIMYGDASKDNHAGGSGECGVACAALSATFVAMTALGAFVQWRFTSGMYTQLNSNKTRASNKRGNQRSQQQQGELIVMRPPPGGVAPVNSHPRQSAPSSIPSATRTHRETSPSTSRVSISQSQSRSCYAYSNAYGEHDGGNPFQERQRVYGNVYSHGGDDTTAAGNPFAGEPRYFEGGRD